MDLQKGSDKQENYQSIKGHIAHFFYINCDLKFNIVGTGFILSYRIGIIGLLLTYEIGLIIRIVNLFKGFNIFFTLLYIISGIQFVLCSNSIYILPFLYGSITMVKRGYALMTVFCWITLGLVNFGFTIFMPFTIIDLKVLCISYMIIFIIMCTLVCLVFILELNIC